MMATVKLAPRFKCAECGEQFKMKWQWWRHKEQAHPEVVLALQAEITASLKARP